MGFLLSVPEEVILDRMGPFGTAPCLFFLFFFPAAPKLAFKGVFPRSVVYSEHVIRLKEKGAVVARWF